MEPVEDVNRIVLVCVLLDAMLVVIPIVVVMESFNQKLYYCHDFKVDESFFKEVFFYYELGTARHNTFIKFNYYKQARRV